MSKMENENVEIQAIETPEVEVKEGFFTKAGKWIAKHKKGIAITAVAGTALAFIIGAFVKKANDEAEEYEIEDDDFDFENEQVDTDE